MERLETRQGKCIDISMLQVAVSWLQTFIPMLDLGSAPAQLRRAGNEHRQFIPVNAYPTSDGFIYLAIGSDLQWSRFARQPLFAALAQDRFSANEGRRQDRVELHEAIGRLTSSATTAQVASALSEAQIPHSRITPIEEVADLPAVAPSLLRTTTPDGRVIRLPPPAASTAHLVACKGELPFAPHYGEHTDAVLGEAGISASEIADLRRKGVIA